MGAATVAYLFPVESAGGLAAVHPCKSVVVVHPARIPVHIPDWKLGAVAANVVSDQNRTLDAGVGGVIAGIQVWDVVVSAAAGMTARSALAANVVYAGAVPPYHSHLAAYPIHRPSCCLVLCGRYSCGMLVSLSDWWYSLSVRGNALLSVMCRSSASILSLLSNIPVLRTR